MSHRHWETGQPCNCGFTTHLKKPKKPHRTGPPATHLNLWGDPCNCAWHKPDHMEHVGAVKEAAKIDWLRERPDVQNDLRKRLILEHEFSRYPAKADPILPWLMREYDKGNIDLHHETKSWLDDVESDKQQYAELIQAGVDPDSEEAQGLQAAIDAGTAVAVRQFGRGYGLTDPQFNYAASFAPHFADMLPDLKRRRQGLDLMQHTWHTLVPRYHEWRKEKEEREAEERRRNNGQIVHRFDEGANKGWTVRRLRDRDDCGIEGDQMGHCAAGYGYDVEGGKTNIYSLRDQKNHPHATMEVKPSDGNPTDPTEWQIPEHAWGELPMKEFQGVPIETIRNRHDHGPYDTISHDADAVYPEFMKRAVEHGTAMPPVRGEVIQTQGKSNSSPLPEYTDMLNEFLRNHDLEAEAFKPWWNDYYTMDGPQDIHELMGHNQDHEAYRDLGLGQYPPDPYESEPEDYRHAQYDAEEHGVDPPELRVGDPDYERILKSLIDPEPVHTWVPDPESETGGRHERRQPWQGYNPTAGEYVLNHARNQDEWEGRYNDNPNNPNVNSLRDALDWVAEPENVEQFQPSQDILGIQDPFQRQKALDQAEREHYKQFQSDPHVQMYNHLGPELIENFQPVGIPSTTHAIHPEQRQLWDPEGVPYNADLTAEKVMGPDPIPNVFSKLASALYKRWVFSPVSGQVELADNNRDPLEVRYHTDLARELNEPNLIHGYAYPIDGGWRLTDWDSKPVEDPYVVAQVMRQLQATSAASAASGPEDGSWSPSYEEDWDKIHLGLPSMPDTHEFALSP